MRDHENNRTGHIMHGRRSVQKPPSSDYSNGCLPRVSAYSRLLPPVAAFLRNASKGEKDEFWIDPRFDFAWHWIAFGSLCLTFACIGRANLGEHPTINIQRPTTSNGDGVESSKLASSKLQRSTKSQAPNRTGGSASSAFANRFTSAKAMADKPRTMERTLIIMNNTPHITVSPKPFYFGFEGSDAPFCCLPPPMAAL